MAADARLSLFEFTIQRVLMRHLERHFDRQPPPKAIHATVAAVARPASVLLSALAYAGQPRAERRRQPPSRPRAGPWAPTARWRSLLPSAQCGVDAIGRALADLAQAAPMVKQKLLEACAATVTWTAASPSARESCCGRSPTAWTARCRRSCPARRSESAAADGLERRDGGAARAGHVEVGHQREARRPGLLLAQERVLAHLGQEPLAERGAVSTTPPPTK